MARMMTWGAIMDNHDIISLEEASQQRDHFVERLLQSTAGTFDIFTIYMGDYLGFYQALADYGWLTPHELASHTSTHERYVQEWFEQQTVVGILEVDDANVEAKSPAMLGCFTLFIDRVNPSCRL